VIKKLVDFFWLPANELPCLTAPRWQGCSTVVPAPGAKRFGITHLVHLFFMAAIIHNKPNHFSTSFRRRRNLLNFMPSEFHETSLPKLRDRGDAPSDVKIN